MPVISGRQQDYQIYDQPVIGIYFYKKIGLIRGRSNFFEIRYKDERDDPYMNDLVRNVAPEMQFGGFEIQFYGILHKVCNREKYQE